MKDNQLIYSGWIGGSPFPKDHYEGKTYPGPCIVCGDTNYSLSMGGPSICPPCDCGIDPKVIELKKELAEVRNKNTRYLLALLLLTGQENRLITPQMKQIAQDTIDKIKKNK